MGSNNFESKSMLRTDSVHWGTCNLVINPGETKYSDHWNLTHLDSVYGVAIEFVGTRYGNNVTVQLQQSMVPNRANSWADVGTSVLLGSGGTSGSPATLDQRSEFYPASGTFMPHLRLKITAAALTSATITDMWRTARGLK